MDKKHKFISQINEESEQKVEDYLNNKVAQIPIDGCMYAFHDCLGGDGKITSALFAVFFNKEHKVAMYVPVEALKESLQINEEKMSLFN